MPYEFSTTEDTIKLFSHIDTLITYASIERDKVNEENRMLFLKLGVVSIVTKFQVFIESILKEYLYHLQNCGKKHGELSLHLRLNSLKLFTSSVPIHKSLENFEIYNDAKLTEVKNYSNLTLSICDDSAIVDKHILLETKFPMGKTGLAELVKLFRQVNGEDIFTNSRFDINKLNEILGRRHAIIHEDSNPQITEQIVKNYKDYIIVVIEYIDEYLKKYK